jgi:Chromo (CHRromatin Organisation MOdifier) domain
VTEVGHNHNLESLVQGPYRVLENAGATFRLRIGAEDVRVSYDRVTPAPRRELSPPPEWDPPSSVPVPPTPVDETPSSPPIYRSEGQPHRPGKRKFHFDPTSSTEARRPSSPDGASTQGEFVVEKLVDFGEAADGTRLYRVRWLGYEASADTWEPEEGLPATFIRRYWKTKWRTIRH